MYEHMPVAKLMLTAASNNVPQRTQQMNLQCTLLQTNLKAAQRVCANFKRNLHKILSLKSVKKQHPSTIKCSKHRTTTVGVLHISKFGA
jgi:hypothetical protein